MTRTTKQKTQQQWKGAFYSSIYTSHRRRQRTIASRGREPSGLARITKQKTQEQRRGAFYSSIYTRRRSRRTISSKNPEPSRLAVGNSFDAAGVHWESRPREPESSESSSCDVNQINRENQIDEESQLSEQSSSLVIRQEELDQESGYLV